MTIVDFGCNDGWLLHHLSDLPFKKMTGVEPRAKNINKGILVRRELKLKNKIEFINGDITALKNKKFDIVLCTGVLYHVESIPYFLRLLKQICKNWIFIESRVINQNNATTEIIRQAELIDLPYKLAESTYGFSVHKFESNYSDGSAHENIVVSLPSSETLIMYLQTLGFENIKIELNEAEFRSKLIRKDRPLDGVFISAKVTSPKGLETNSNYLKTNSKKIESMFQSVTLPNNVLNLLTDANFKRKSRIFVLPIDRLILEWLQPENFHDDKLQEKLIKRLKLSKEQGLIFKDIKFNPNNKLDFERAKISFENKDFKNALFLTDRVLNTPNADWRSVYRSLYLQYRIGKVTKNPKLMAESRKNLKICNASYPLC